MWMRLISGHREVCLCGLDRCVCRWAAARPRDRRTRAFGSESSISKPGQALPPPTGTLHTGGAFHCCAHPIQAPPPTGAAAKPHSQASLVPQLTRRPPHRRCLVCWWVIGVVLKPGQVLPPPTGTHRHRSQAPRASRCPQQRAVPGVLVGDRRRFKARPGPAPAHRHRSWAPAGAICPALVSNLARWGVQH